MYASRGLSTLSMSPRCGRYVTLRPLTRKETFAAPRGGISSARKDDPRASSRSGKPVGAMPPCKAVGVLTSAFDGHGELSMLPRRLGHAPEERRAMAVVSAAIRSQPENKYAVSFSNTSAPIVPLSATPGSGSSCGWLLVGGECSSVPSWGTEGTSQ